MPEMVSGEKKKMVFNEAIGGSRSVHFLVATHYADFLAIYSIQGNPAQCTDSQIVVIFSQNYGKA
jgi:hypothetical protein